MSQYRRGQKEALIALAIKQGAIVTRRGACAFDGCANPLKYPGAPHCESHTTMLSRKGVLAPLKLNFWTPDQLEKLRAFYAAPIKRGDLAVFATTINKLKSNVSRKAREMGLTNRKRVYGRKPTRKVGAAGSPELLAHLSHQAVERIQKNGHPRGMAGKKHSEATLARLRVTSTENWKNQGPERQQEITMKALHTRLEKYGTLATNPRPGTTWKAGWREVGGNRIYFRSRWEFNYGLYLEWLKSLGEIAKWEHEPETFWFDGIRRGCVSYLPDFRITNPNNSIEYHEVKGWMDSRSATKLKRMKKYHPTVKLLVIDAKWFKANGHIIRALPGHESWKH